MIPRLNYTEVMTNDKVLFSFLACQDSSVGIATHYVLDGPWIESRLVRDFTHQPRPALGHDQPLVGWGFVSFPGVK